MALELFGQALSGTFKQKIADLDADESNIFRHLIRNIVRALQKLRLRKVHFSGDILGGVDLLKCTCYPLGHPERDPLNQNFAEW